MSRHGRIATGVVLGSMLGAGIGVVLPAAIVAESADERVIASAPVPDAERRHGEVALLVRGETSVVQVFLYSRLLRRVVAEIEFKEQRNWPLDSPFARDSARYVEALRSAERAVWARHRRADERREHMLKLVIELAVAADGVSVSLYELPVTAPAERASLARRSLVKRLDLQRGYVERNFYLVAEDAVGLTPAEAAERLRAAGGWTPPLPDRALTP